jgi:hypothetical protein
LLLASKFHNERFLQPSGRDPLKVLFDKNKLCRLFNELHSGGRVPEIEFIVRYKLCRLFNELHSGGRVPSIELSEKSKSFRLFNELHSGGRVPEIEFSLRYLNGRFPRNWIREIQIFIIYGSWKWFTLIE